MRIVAKTLQVAAVAALIAAGCGRPQDPPAEPAKASVANVANVANVAETAAAAEGDLDPGVADNQTLEQVLDRTMNRFAKLDLNGDGKLQGSEISAGDAGRKARPASGAK